MQYWIDHSGIDYRPMPKFGLTAEEVAAEKREALAWGFETGAVRSIVQAYRQARYNGDSGLTARNIAADVALSLGRPNGKVNETVSVLLNWAATNHRHWFYAFERYRGSHRQLQMKSPPEHESDGLSLRRRETQPTPQLGEIYCS
jgi:hypothetical protein